MNLRYVCSASAAQQKYTFPCCYPHPYPSVHLKLFKIVLGNHVNCVICTTTAITIQQSPSCSGQTLHHSPSACVHLRPCERLKIEAAGGGRGVSHRSGLVQDQQQEPGRESCNERCLRHQCGEIRLCRGCIDHRMTRIIHHHAHPPSSPATSLFLSQSFFSPLNPSHTLQPSFPRSSNYSFVKHQLSL